MRHKRMLLSIDRHENSSWIHKIQFAYISEASYGYVLNKETFAIRPGEATRVVHRIPLFKFFLRESIEAPGYAVTHICRMEDMKPQELWDQSVIPATGSDESPEILRNAISEIGLSDVNEVLLFLQAFESTISRGTTVFNMQPIHVDQFLSLMSVFSTI